MRITVLAIDCNNLSKTYRGKRMTKVEALKNLSFQLEPGEVFGFLGPNGAGKSTTIKILMGLVKADSGTARLNGIDIASADSRRSVGFLPENPAFYEYLSAAEYLRFVGAAFGMSNDQLQLRSEAVLKRVDLWDARNRPVRGYSKGMVQRLGLAQVLVHDPDLYILDEPMSGLDPLGRALVKELIIELKDEGKCVFFSSHITADVEEVCDRVGVILKGELKRVESVDTLMSKGISAYRVVSHDGDGDSVDLAAPEKLHETLASLERRGRKVSLVEPVRKNLEQFFLDIVREG